MKENWIQSAHLKGLTYGLDIKSCLKSYILIIIFFLTACSSPNPYPINTSLQNSVDRGILVISAKNDCNLIGPIRFTKYHIRSRDRQVAFSAVRDTSTSKEYITHCALVDFYNVPIGEYEIYSWQSSMSTTFSRWFEKPKNDFSIPFKVEAGKVNYLGQILLDSDYGISFGNMKERDLETLYDKYPFLSDLAVVEPFSYDCKIPNKNEIEASNSSRNVLYAPTPAVK